MDMDQASADYCASCRHPLEIVTVRFNLAGAQVISACPNCAITETENAGPRRDSDSHGRTTDALMGADDLSIATQRPLLDPEDVFPDRRVF